MKSKHIEKTLVIKTPEGYLRQSNPVYAPSSITTNIKKLETFDFKDYEIAKHVASLTNGKLQTLTTTHEIKEINDDDLEAFKQNKPYKVNP